MKKFSNIVLWALIAVAAVTVAMWLFSPNAAGTEGGPEANVVPMLIATASFLGLGILLLVGMSALNMGKGRSSSKLSLIVFGGMAVIGIILYFTAASDAVVIGADATKPFTNPFELKITDTMIYLTYIALGITVVTLLWGVVRKALK